MNNETARVYVFCYDSNGSQTVQAYDIEAAQQVISDGEHYELAENDAKDEGYDGPFFCIDHEDAVRISERLEKLLLPRSAREKIAEQIEE